MIQILLVLEMFLYRDIGVENLLHCAKTPSNTSLFFREDYLCLWLESVQKHLKHDFAGMSDETDSPVVLAKLRVSFLRSWMIRDWVHMADHDHSPKWTGIF